MLPGAHKNVEHGNDDTDVLIRGARAIAKEVFDDRFSDRQVYRLLETDPTWPAKKLLGQWTGYRGRMRAEVRRRLNGEAA
jgi:hypothetical protein